MWLERFIIVVTTTAHDYIPSSWGSYLPSPIELGIAGGALCLFSLLFVLFVRHLPPVAMAELKAEEWRRGAGEVPPAPAVLAALGSRPDARSSDRRYVLGVFARADTAARAARDLTGAGHAVSELFAPFDVPTFRRAEGTGGGLALRAAGLFGGLVGASLGLVIPALAAAAFDRRVGSKPAFPLPSYLVVSCELALLFAAVAVLGGLALELARHGRRLRAAPAHDRLTRDRFGVLLMTAPGEVEHGRGLLTAAGAEEVRG
jgi:molybdopterin-containing oxidoreductase family membrane subunit